MGIDKNLVQGSMALLLLRLLETKRYVWLRND